MEQDQTHVANTRPTNRYHTTIAKPSARTQFDMGIRDRVSRLKEKLELRSTGRRRKLDGTGSGTDGEGLDPAGSLPRPIPYVVAG